MKKFTDTKGWYPGIEIRPKRACSIRDVDASTVVPSVGNAAVQHPRRRREWEPAAGPLRRWTSVRTSSSAPATRPTTASPSASRSRSRRSPRTTTSRPDPGRARAGTVARARRSHRDRHGSNHGAPGNAGGLTLSRFAADCCRDKPCRRLGSRARRGRDGHGLSTADGDPDARWRWRVPRVPDRAGDRARTIRAGDTGRYPAIH